MKKSKKKMNFNLDSALQFFKYIYIGATTVVKGTIKFLMCMCLGAYYALFYLILKPSSMISSILADIKYTLFTPKHVKKDKALKIEVNYDEKGEKIESTNKKDIYSQMKANQKKSIKTKPKAKLTDKQKQKLKDERDQLIKMINDGQEKRLEKPQTFRYKAMTPDGKVIVNTFVGVSKLDIYTFLTGEGYTVYSIETSSWINLLYGDASAKKKKMNTKDLIFFITQLGTYIKAGITLTEAMRILSKQMGKDKNLQKILQSIVYDLTMGESFSGALQHQQGVFPQLVGNMIKAAEAAGNLDETLDELGNYYTEINSTKKQMISALSYPAFIGVFSVIIIAFIMVFIVPKFVGIYASAGAELNILTQIVISLSNFLQEYILVIILLVALLIFIIYMAYKYVKAVKILIQTIIMKIPVFGKIVIYNEITIFTKTFSSLLKNDVFITDTIEILSNLTNNEIYKEIMLNTISNIARGEKISESFNNHWAVPDIAYYMIVTGENTGQLATMMSKVSAYYQEQHKTMINSMKSLIEPLMIIMLALVVGGVMIAVILPMFQLYGSIEV